MRKKRKGEREVIEAEEEGRKEEEGKEEKAGNEGNEEG